MALTTEAAESSETSCSPLRPPKSTPTRSFFMTFQCGRDEESTSIAGMVPEGQCPVTRRHTSAPLQDLLAECREGQFHGEIGGLVPLVNDRIHFDDLEAQHSTVI